jgi:sulfopropanediol 3-dehydrogenase
MDTMRVTLKKAAIGSAGAHVNPPEIVDIVAQVIEDVRSEGDDAVARYSTQFDRWTPSSFRLSPDAIRALVKSVPDSVLSDLSFAQEQVLRFARAQRASLTDFEIETLPGVHLGQRNIPISDVGAYVPGGRYPLTASAHMTVVTAKVAGVGRVAATTPPHSGAPPPISVAAMSLAGADEIYVLGGIQAIAAFALGTETIAPVHLIAGPGNAYVAEAKRQLFGEIGIDLFAGPTELLIVADESADSYTVAVDLLSQAEHGPDSPVILVTTSERVGNEAIRMVDELLADLPTAPVAGTAWRDYGEVILVDRLDEAFEIADQYASEHVEVLTENPRIALDALTNYGALFLGDRTCVPFGDKVIGTNHVLPTLGAARYTGGLWVGKYLKTVTYQEVTDGASSALLGEICGRASRVEKFEGHARSGDLRAARFGDKHYDWINERRLNRPGS